MTNREFTIEEINTLARLIAAYGADPSRWPAEEAALFPGVTEEMLAGLEDLAGPVEEARAVDALLAAAPRATASEALQRRILADYDALAGAEQVRRGARRSVWAAIFGGRPMIPAGALAGLTALGFAVGVVSADAGRTYTTEDEALYVMEAVFSDTLIEEEVSPWAEG